MVHMLLVLFCLFLYLATAKSFTDLHFCVLNDGYRGYTPAECTVLGVPSVTSNLTGFANFMRRRLDDSDSKGIFVVDRRFKAPHESVEQITNIMWRFCQLDRRERIELRNKTERLSELLDWKNLGKAYSTARELALQRLEKVMSNMKSSPTTFTPSTTSPTTFTPPTTSPTAKAKADVEGVTKRVVGWNVKEKEEKEEEEEKQEKQTKQKK